MPAPATSRCTSCAPASCGRRSAPTSPPGMVSTLRGNAARLGLDVDARVADAEALPFEDGVLRPRPRPRRAAPPARPRRAPSASSAACCARAGPCVFAGEPSRHGDRLAAYPKRAAARLAPLWRRALRASAAPEGHADGGASNHELEAHVDVHAFTPEELGGFARRAGFEHVRVRRRGAAGELVRLDEPRAREHRRRRGGAVRVEALRLPRLPPAAEGRRAPARGPACRRRSSTTSCSRRARRARRAQPAQHDLAGVDPRARRGARRASRPPCRRPRRRRRPAPQRTAGQMRVAVGDGVEEDRPAGLDAAHEAELLEELERRVDRRQRQAGQPLAGGARQLLGGGVSAEPRGAPRGARRAGS